MMQKNVYEKSEGPESYKLCEPRLVDLFAEGSKANLVATSHKVKISDAQKRALIDVVTLRRRCATFQELADYLSIGRLDVARLLARYTYRNFKGELIVREVTP
jgi:hypothetical protein